MMKVHSAETIDSSLLVGRAFQLVCPVKKYDWGISGADSVVYRLALENYPDRIDCSERDPAAELWAGDHESGSSLAVIEGRLYQLTDLIKHCPKELLGEEALSEFGDQLPFLFKVLAVDRGLSIQAHPTQVEAKRLHKEDPVRYPYPNHKPELFQALTDTNLLWGFLPLENIASYLSSTPELAELLGDAVVGKVQAAVGADEAVQSSVLEELDSALLNVPLELALQRSLELVSRLETEGTKNEADQWLLQQVPYFPSGDRGLFYYYLMNCVCVPAGSAVYTGADRRHSYQSGSLIECMARSDITLRAGLTSKDVDIPNLIRSTSYDFQAPQILEPTVQDGESCEKSFDTPAKEFHLSFFDEPVRSRSLSPKRGPQLFFGYSGEGVLRFGDQELPISPGVSIFVPDSEAALELTLNQGVLYRVSLPLL